MRPLLHLDVLQPEHAFDRRTAIVADHPVPGRQPDAIDFAPGLGRLTRLFTISRPDLEGVLARQGLAAVGNPDNRTGFVFYLGLEQERCQVVQGRLHYRRRSNKKPVRGSSLIAE